MVDLKVMAYFKISLSTRNWDRAKKNPARCGAQILPSEYKLDTNSTA